MRTSVQIIMTKQIKDNEFESEVINSKLPVLIDFWAEWCGPCRMLSPILDQLSEEMEGKVKIVKMNIDENPETPSKFGVRGIPTMLLFKEGKQIATKVGVQPKNALQEWINSSL
jgi:thioredoxin 1